MPPLTNRTNRFTFSLRSLRAGSSTLAVSHHLSLYYFGPFAPYFRLPTSHLFLLSVLLATQSCFPPSHLFSLFALLYSATLFPTISSTLFPWRLVFSSCLCLHALFFFAPSTLLLLTLTMIPSLPLRRLLCYFRLQHILRFYFALLPPPLTSFTRPLELLLLSSLTLVWLQM